MEPLLLRHRANDERDELEIIDLQGCPSLSSANCFSGTVTASGMISWRPKSLMRARFVLNILARRGTRVEGLRSSHCADSDLLLQNHRNR
jgi:hypothetical protein